jgi:hypothetical protein
MAPSFQGFVLAAHDPRFPLQEACQNSMIVDALTDIVTL